LVNDDKLLPLRAEHFKTYREMFGEANLDWAGLPQGESGLEWLVRKVNEKWRWYEDMLKRLRREIIANKKGTDLERFIIA